MLTSSTIIPICLTVATLSAVIALIMLHKNKKSAAEASLRETVWPKFIGIFDKSKTFEQSLSDFLEVISTIIPAPGYYMYTLDHKSNQLVLRSVRSAVLTQTVGPNYAGLVAHDRDKYSPAFSIPLSDLPATITIKKEGDINIIFWPITDKDDNTKTSAAPGPGKKENIPVGLILIGHLDDPNPQIIKRITAVEAGLAPWLKIIVEYYYLRQTLQSESAASSAINTITRSTMEPRAPSLTHFQ